jgi:hypothetical protein
MNNIIKKAVISLSFVSLIMVGFGSFALAEPMPFEKGVASTCNLIKAPVTAQLSEEIRAGLASNAQETVLVCSVSQPSDNTQQLNDENRFGGR